MGQRLKTYRAYKLDSSGKPAWIYGGKTWEVSDPNTVYTELAVYTAGVEIPEQADGKLEIVEFGSPRDRELREQYLYRGRELATPTAAETKKPIRRRAHKEPQLKQEEMFDESEYAGTGRK